MRKIIVSTGIDTNSFQPMVSVFEVTGPGQKEVYLEEYVKQTPSSKYTPEEQAKIDLCNRALSEKGKDPLTEEEIEYMLDPGGLAKRVEHINNEMQDHENLQKLAGFRVEKRIVPVENGDKNE